MIFRESKELNEIIRSLDKIFPNSKYWVCAGVRQNIVKTIRFALSEGNKFTYWGIKTEDIKELIGPLERARGGVLVHYKSLIERFLKGDKPDTVNIAYLYCTNTRTFLAAGIVTAIEFARYELFWPDEYDQNNVIYPYRLRLYLIWIHKSILENYDSDEKWFGDDININLPHPTPGIISISRDKDKLVSHIMSKINEINEFLGMDLTVFKSKLETHKYVQPSYETFASKKVSRSFIEVIRERFIISDEDLDKIYEIESVLRSKRKSILFTGPPGSGKTELARLITEALNYDIIEISCHQYLSKAELIGDFILTGQGLDYKAGALVRALSKIADGANGVVVIIDEINRVDFDKIAADLMTILGSREWKVPESLVLELSKAANGGSEDARKAIEVLKRHNYTIPDNIIFIATMNSFDISALFRLGYATLRRFKVIEITWSENTIKKIINEKVSKLKTDIALKAKNFLKDLLQIRELVNILQPGIILEFLDIMDLLTDKESEKAIKIAFKETISQQLPIIRGINEKVKQQIYNVLRKYEMEDLMQKFDLIWEM